MEFVQFRIWLVVGRRNQGTGSKTQVAHRQEPRHSNQGAECVATCGLGIGAGFWSQAFRTRAAIDRTTNQNVRSSRQDVRPASLFRCVASWVQVWTKRQDPGYRTCDTGQDSNQDATKKWCQFNGIGFNLNGVVVESVGIAPTQKECVANLWDLVPIHKNQ